MLKKLVAVMLSAVLWLSGGSVVMAEETEMDDAAKLERIAEIEEEIARLQAELKELKGETGVEEGDILYQDDEVVITYDGLEEGTFLGKPSIKINFVIENLSDQKLTIQTRDTSINGFMVDDSCSIEVASGKKAKDGSKVYGEDIEGFDTVDKVESIETGFIVYRGNGFMDSYKTDSIVIK